MSDVLVVYYSRSGTTETAARRLANILDADLDEVVALQGYDGILGFLRCVYQASRRERPDIATGKDPSRYRLVIVGSPVWAGCLAAPLRTYLDRHREALSAVAAFCTSESGDGRPVFEQMAELLRRPLLATLSLGRAPVLEGRAEGALRAWALSLPYASTAAKAA